MPLFLPAAMSLKRGWEESPSSRKGGCAICGAGAGAPRAADRRKQVRLCWRSPKDGQPRTAKRAPCSRLARATRHLTSRAEIPQEVQQLPTSRSRLVWRGRRDRRRDVVASQQVQQIVCLRGNNPSSHTKPASLRTKACVPQARPPPPEGPKEWCTRTQQTRGREGRGRTCPSLTWLGGCRPEAGGLVSKTVGSASPLG